MAGFILSSISTLIVLTLLQPSNCITDHCLTPSCNHDEYLSIHFPFRLPRFNNKTSCSYDQNFTLSCSAQNQTLLHLPNAGSFVVEDISYSKQSILISDTCFPQRIFNGFDLSNSAFTTSNNYNAYTFYNCTSLDPSYYSSYFVSCMSGSDRGTIWMMPGGQRTVTNCSHVKTVYSAPDHMSLGNWYDHTTSVELYWYEPSCGLCLSNGGICGYKGHSQSIGCRPAKGHGLSDGAKYGIISGIAVTALVLLIIVIIIRSCRCSRSETAHEQRPPAAETQLMQNQPSAVQLGHDGPTAESYPKNKMGQNEALLDSTKAQ